MPTGPPKTGESWWKGLTECGPLEKGIANNFYCWLENPMNSMKRQYGRILKEELPGQKVPNMLLEMSGEITPERVKRWSQSKKNIQLWM